MRRCVAVHFIADAAKMSVLELSYLDYCSYVRKTTLKPWDKCRRNLL